MSTHGARRSRGGGEPPRRGAGGTHGFAFGTSVTLVAWSTGFALEVEGEKGKSHLAPD